MQDQIYTSRKAALLPRYTLALRQASHSPNLFLCSLPHPIRDLLDIDSLAKRMVLVMDNLNTHTLASMYEAHERTEVRCLAGRLELRYTPKHGSWLNMTEFEIGAMVGQFLDRRILDPDRETMRGEIAAWQTSRSRESVRVD